MPASITLAVVLLCLFLTKNAHCDPQWAAEQDPQYWYEVGRRNLKSQLAKKFNDRPAKNAVLFIGDGMGVSTVTAGRIRYGQRLGQLGESYVTAMDKLPYVGLAKTYNIDYQTPDSAATATAYLCGVKARYGTLGVDGYCPRGDCVQCRNHGVESIFHAAKRAGKSTGIVTTTRITHASPASGYAASPERDWETYDNKPGSFGDAEAKLGCKDIADQLVSNPDLLDVVIGGGRRNFLPRTVVDPEYPTMTGERVDGRNLVEEWLANVTKKHGSRARYVWSSEEFAKLDPTEVDVLLALLEPSHMQYETDRERLNLAEPSLANTTAKAIQILSKNPNGYVLFVEGGRIDHGHHDTRTRYCLDEFVAFDDAIRKCREMTDEDETQIVVSADHSHTFSFGGYSYRNDDILGLVTDGEKNKSAADGSPFTIILYANGPGYVDTDTRRNKTYWENLDVKKLDYLYASAVPLDSETHGGEDVPIYASGPRGHLYVGTLEQSNIYHTMVYSLCLEEYKNDPNCWSL